MGNSGSQRQKETVVLQFCLQLFYSFLQFVHSFFKGFCYDLFVSFSALLFTPTRIDCPKPMSEPRTQAERSPPIPARGRRPRMCSYQK